LGNTLNVWLHARIIGRVCCVVIALVCVCVFKYVCVPFNIFVFECFGGRLFRLRVGLDCWWHDHELCGCSGACGVRDARIVYEHGADREYVEGSSGILLPLEGARALVCGLGRM
jgi:hypothetical protein